MNWKLVFLPLALPVELIVGFTTGRETGIGNWVLDRRLGGPKGKWWQTRRAALLAVLFFFSALATHAAGLQITWDASPSPGVTNYVLYSALGTNALGTPVSVGTNQTLKISSLAPGIWKFAVTAVRTNLESDFSSVLLVDVPAPPVNLRTIALQANATLTGGAWTNAGFFRLEILP